MVFPPSFLSIKTNIIHLVCQYVFRVLNAKNPTVYKTRSDERKNYLYTNRSVTVVKDYLCYRGLSGSLRLEEWFSYISANLEYQEQQTNTCKADKQFMFSFRHIIHPPFGSLCRHTLPRIGAENPCKH